MLYIQDNHNTHMMVPHSYIIHTGPNIQLKLTTIYVNLSNRLEDTGNFSNLLPSIGQQAQSLEMSIRSSMGSKPLFIIYLIRHLYRAL